jgi:two-component system OmpR family sensor kinase
MDRPRSLRLQLTFLVATLTAAAICLFASVFYVVLRANLLAETDDRLQDRANLILAALSVSNGPGVATRLPKLPPLVEFDAPGIYVELRDSTGALLAASPNLGDARLPDAMVLRAAVSPGEPAHETVRAGYDEDLRLLAMRVSDAVALGGVLIVAESLEPTEGTLAQARELLLACGVGAVLLVVAGATLLTGAALAPMARLTRAAARIAATGHYHERVPTPARQDEVGQLAATVNDLIATVARTLEAQRQLLADTSHELRSPLTAVLANLDLLRRDLAAPERELCVGEASNEAQRMRRLVNDLLLLAQADATQVIARAPVALDRLVAETTTTMARQAIAHHFDTQLARELVVQGDQERLTQALRNLLENAVRYTPPGTTVRVTLGAEADGQARITIADTGPGIDAVHLPRLWDRFYRVDRSRAAGGSGLGLAIVRYITEAHGGSVAVESAPGQGTAFHIRLPLAQTPIPLPGTYEQALAR